METFAVMLSLGLLGVALLAHLDRDFYEHLQSKPVGIIFCVFLFGVVCGYVFKG